MKKTDVQALISMGFSDEDIWIDGSTAASLIGISWQTLRRWSAAGDFVQPRKLGTRGLAKLGLTDRGNERQSQVLRYNLAEIRQFMANEPKAGKKDTGTGDD